MFSRGRNFRSGGGEAEILSFPSAAWECVLRSAASPPLTPLPIPSLRRGFGFAKRRLAGRIPKQRLGTTKWGGEKQTPALCGGGGLAEHAAATDASRLGSFPCGEKPLSQSSAFKAASAKPATQEHKAPEGVIGRNCSAFFLDVKIFSLSFPSAAWECVLRSAASPPLTPPPDSEFAAGI